MTVDFFPDSEKFCKILYLIVVKKKKKKKKNCAQSIYVVCRMFLVEATKDPVYSLTMVGAVFCVVIKN